MSKRQSGIDVIKREHRNLAKVLRCLKAASEVEVEGRPHPDMAICTTAFDYVESFLNTFHHPKENIHLFTALRLRRPDLTGILDLLERQHHDGEQLLRDARAAMYAYHDDRDVVAFKNAMDRYCQFEFDHMRLEETDILPAAEESLTVADHAALDRAFLQNNDPIFGAARKAQFSEIFDYLVGNSTEDHDP